MDVDMDLEMPDYKMDHKNRGMALIFNHNEFHKRLRLEIRDGTDKDCIEFKKTLKFLGYTDIDIKIHNDLSQDEVDSELKRVAEKVDHTHNDCLVVAIFSHGNEDYVYTYDNRMRYEKLWEPFVADKCPTLAGKPKLFFIQSCQGGQIDPGFEMETADSISTYKIPCYADFLIHCSTISGYKSWRDNRGSWFIQALCEILLNHGRQYDLLSLLTFVNQKVALKYETNVFDDLTMHKKKQIPCINSMLTKRVYFFPVK